MSCSFSSEQIKEAINFHRHSCPGLAIGIRAAEYVTIEFGDLDPADFVCVTETDMCGVDGIQYFTGCTFGKGNLIHRDYGKMAFSFYDRSKKMKGIRLLFHLVKEELGKEEMIARIMSAQLPELFSLTQLETGPPSPARVLESLMCEECKEKIMESRTRRFAGKTLCIPCFEAIEQKI